MAWLRALNSVMHSFKKKISLVLKKYLGEYLGVSVYVFVFQAVKGGGMGSNETQ